METMAVIHPTWVVTLLVFAGVYVGYKAFVKRRYPYLVIGLTPMVIAGIVYFTEPSPPPPPPAGAVVTDIGGACNFSSRYRSNPTLYGQPIGSCGMRNGLLTCSFTYAYMACHPEIKDEYWRIQNTNLGEWIRKARGVVEDLNPVVPSIVASMLSSELAKNVDILAVYGYARTNPILEGDHYFQYWDKTILKWKSSSTDPTEVKREPVGSMVWQDEHNEPGAIKLDPWTNTRKWLLALAAICVLVSLAGVRFFGGRNNSNPFG